MEENKQLSQQVDELVEGFKREGHKRVSTAVTDIDGVMLGKYVKLDKFTSIAKDGGTWCDCIFGWDINDKLYDHLPGRRGCHPGYPDQKYKVNLSTMRRLPDENNMPFFLGQFYLDNPSSLYPTCSRCVLERVITRAAEMGLGVKLASEYEFFLFAETPDSVREKDYQRDSDHSFQVCVVTLCFAIRLMAVCSMISWITV